MHSNLQIFTTGRVKRDCSRNTRESIVQALSGGDCNNRGGYDNDITENRRYRSSEDISGKQSKPTSELYKFRLSRVFIAEIIINRFAIMSLN